MRITCTHPGRHGDILWALPTVRAIAQAYDAKVDLVIPELYGGLAELLKGQSYISSVLALSEAAWPIQQTAPITPRYPEWQTSQPPDRLFHLGYAGWPSPTLPEDVYERACKLGVGSGAKAGDPILPVLDLTTPWLTADYSDPVLPPEPGFVSVWTCGFTDEHFELKYGIWRLLTDDHVRLPSGELVSDSPRWNEETVDGGVHSWITAARWIARSRVFFGCCSALHVLAVGLGIPCVIMEPAKDRLHPTFWPCGQDGPQVRLVRGTDGQATFDARHCAEVLREVLRGR